MHPEKPVQAGSGCVPAENVSAEAGILDQDVGCPECGYNLRGLAQDRATCPECGLESDVAQLLIRRWDKPWYRAPKYNLLCLPAAISFLAFLGWVGSNALADSMGSDFTPARILTAWLVGGLACWAAAMAWIWSRMDGPVSCGFAALAHIPIVGYIGGIGVFLAGLIVTITWFYDLSDNQSPDTERLLIGIGLLVGGVCLFGVARWVEKIVAQHCIRLYLRMPTSSG